MESSERIFFLDALRAFLILLVVATHVAVSYVSFPGWIHNATLNDAFWIPAGLLESCVLMSAMFFIAGYFTLPSLQRRNAEGFEKGKLLRIGLPYLVGVGVLAPSLAVAAAHQVAPGLYFRSALKVVFSARYFTLYHFWFLGVLLLFFSAAALACSRWPRARRLPAAKPGMMSFGLSAGFVLLAAAVCFGVNLFAPSVEAPDVQSRWTRLYILQFETVKIPQYIGYFLLGMYAYRKQWFRGEVRYRILPRALIYAVVFVVRFGLLLRLSGTGYGVAGKLAMNFAYSVEIMAFLQVLLAIFKRFGNRGGSFSRAASANSFAAYLVHLHVLFAVLLLSRNIAMPLALKYVAQISLVALLSWAVAAVLRRIPRVRNVL